MVRKTHFGGFNDEEEEDDDQVYLLNLTGPFPLIEISQPARKKSKAEVMAEVMAKSKEHKVYICSYIPNSYCD